MIVYPSGPMRDEDKPVGVKFPHLAICLGHKRRLTVDDLMNAEGWASLTASFDISGFARPDQERARLEFVEIDDQGAASG